MLREEFAAALEKVQTVEEAEALFEKEGMDINALMAEEAEEEELSEVDLEDVAGGVSAKQLKKILVAAFKRLGSGGWKGAAGSAVYDSAVLITAYWDVMKHGNATRTFSEKKIMAAAKRFGLV